MTETRSTDDAARPGASRVRGWREHPARHALSGEIHARPFPDVHPPERVSHLAFTDAAAEDERRHLAALCARFDVAAPAEGATNFSHDFGPFRLRWERHGEFATYTVIVSGSGEAPFADPALDRVPGDWLDGIDGACLVAFHLAIVVAAPGAVIPDGLATMFRGNTLSASDMISGAARVWTDFRIHDDGFGRVLVEDRGLVAAQAGRLVQRLLEIETYRAMALLGLPVAHRTAPVVAEIDATLATLTARTSESSGLDDERRLLDELSRLAARLERVIAANSYRFGASRAYHALVQNRLVGLRERRIEGFQPWGEFLERRLTPAIRTCESLASRQESLSRRLARASDLLRTRVDVTLEAQNRDLLASMNRRVKLQIRLQQTVEGLSVVAISYYGVGLVGYGFKALKAAGVALSTDLATGLSVPLVVVIVWWAVRRLKRVVGER